MRAFLEMLALVLPLVSCTLVPTLLSLACSLVPLIIFLLYGFFGREPVVLWAKIGLELSDGSTVVLETCGVFVFLNGVGNVVTGPMSAQLIVLYEYASISMDWGGTSGPSRIAGPVCSRARSQW